jgi:hypothetical protein
VARSIKAEADLFYADLMGVRTRGGGGGAAVLEDIETATPIPKTSAPVQQIAARPALQILSPAKKPLPALRWAVYQGQSSVFTGTLDAQGWTGPIDKQGGKFDPAQPFRLHVDGCVCVIDSGAQLLVKEPDVEYGGQFVDWTHADDPDVKKRDAFWQAYAKARKIQGPRDVFRFIQHDHVMRRPIKLLTRQLRATFEARPLAIRLGPLVRFTDARRALIWLELETPGLVRVTYGKAANQQAVPGPKQAPAATNQRFGTTVRVGGRHFALIQLDGLDTNSFYQYSITLAPQPAAGPLPIAQTQFTETVFPKQLLHGGTPSVDLASISFSGSEWLFFRTLEEKTQALRFAHGSCRKWPNDSGEEPPVDLGPLCKRYQKPPGKVLTPKPDMLELFGSHWMAKNKTTDWPRFFVHTGDQIYADDIGVNMGTTILQHRVAAVTPGPPGGKGDVVAGAWAGRFAPRYISSQLAKAPNFTNLDEFCKLRPRTTGNSSHDVDFAIRRAIAARRQQAFRNRPAPVLPQPHRVANELLWAFPDYESEVPFIDKINGLRARQRYEKPREPGHDFRIDYPSAGETGGVHAADFAEYAALYEQAWSSTAARRVLAHLPSFMIFDDHEVTDDWNADKGWLEMVHSDKDPLRYWPHTITDALCAYWMYQGWGNLSPDRWTQDSRVQILDQCRKQGRDALPELRRLVHDQSVMKTKPTVKPDNKLDWSFELPAGNIPFMAIDLRTDRDVNFSGGMSDQRMTWLTSKLTNSTSQVAVIVLPVPYLMPDPLLFVFRHLDFTTALARERSSLALQRGSDIEHPAGNAVWDQIKNLIAALQKSKTTLKTVVFISGDIHFSCNFDGQIKGSRKPPRMVQLISSGLQQAVSATKQGQLASAYRGGFHLATGSKGVDEHRGIRITVGGMKRNNKAINFLFDTSVALVDIKLLPAGGDSTLGFMPLVKQRHLVRDTGPTLAEWEFQHSTQSDGRGSLTVNDPGIASPGGKYPRPSAGPDRTAVIEGAEAAGEVVLVESTSGDGAFVEDFEDSEDREDFGEALDMNDARRKTFREMWDLMAKYRWKDTPALFTNELMIAICWEESTFMNIWQQGKNGAKGPAKGFGQLEPSAYSAINRKFKLGKSVAELQALTDADAFAISFIGRALHTLHDNMLAENPKQASEPEKLKRRVLLYGYGGYAFDHAQWRIEAIDGWYAAERVLLAGKGPSGYPTRTAAMQALDAGTPRKRKFPEPLWTQFREKLCATLPDP